MDILWSSCDYRTWSWSSQTLWLIRFSSMWFLPQCYVFSHNVLSVILACLVGSSHTTALITQIQKTLACKVEAFRWVWLIMWMSTRVEVSELINSEWDREKEERRRAAPHTHPAHHTAIQIERLEAPCGPLGPASQSPPHSSWSAHCPVIATAQAPPETIIRIW